MKKFLKTMACLYLGLGATSAIAETITFNGRNTIPEHEYIKFDIADYGDLILIKKVSIDEPALETKLRDQQAEFIKNITLVIPGRVGNKNIHIRNGAFANLCPNLLQLKLSFTPVNYRRGNKVIKRYVEFPVYCNEMFTDSWSVTEVDLKGINPMREIERSDGMFKGCFNLGKVNLGNLNLSKAEDMSRMFYGCTNLADLEIGTKINVNKMAHARKMFDGCNNLKHLKIKFNKHISTDIDYNRVTGKFKVSPKIN